MSRQGARLSSSSMATFVPASNAKPRFPSGTSSAATRRPCRLKPISWWGRKNKCQIEVRLLAVHEKKELISDETESDEGGDEDDGTDDEDDQGEDSSEDDGEDNGDQKHVCLKAPVCKSK